MPRARVQSCPSHPVAASVDAAGCVYGHVIPAVFRNLGLWHPPVELDAHIPSDQVFSRWLGTAVIAFANTIGEFLFSVTAIESRFFFQDSRKCLFESQIGSIQVVFEMEVAKLLMGGGVGKSIFSIGGEGALQFHADTE